MATYYISPTGNDTTGNGSSGTPWATINKAQNSSVNGDTIMMAAGSYTLSSLEFTKSLIWQGAAAASGRPTSIWDGAGAHVRLGVEPAAGSTVTFNDVWIKNITQTSDVGVFICANIANITASFTRCVFSGIALRSSAASDGYNLFHLNQTHPTIRLTTCLIYDVITAASSSAFAALSDGRNGTIALTNCTIYHGASGGSQLGALWRRNVASGTYTVTIKNSIIMSTSSLAYAIGSGISVSTASYSNLYNITSAPTGTGVITSDPLFVDAANANFQLRPGSPCLDTGTLS